MINRTIHRYRWSLPYFFHLLDHGGKAAGDRTGQKAGQYNGKDQDCQVDKQQLKDQLITLGDQWSGRKDRYHVPVRNSNAVEACVYSFPQNILLDEIIGGHKGVLDGIIVQPVNTGEGVIRGSHSTVTVINNIGYTSLKSQIF